MKKNILPFLIVGGAGLFIVSNRKKGGGAASSSSSPRSDLVCITTDLRGSSPNVQFGDIPGWEQLLSSHGNDVRLTFAVVKDERDFADACEMEVRGPEVRWIFITDNGENTRSQLHACDLLKKWMQHWFRVEAYEEICDYIKSPEGRVVVVSWLMRFDENRGRLSGEYMVISPDGDEIVFDEVFGIPSEV